MFSKLDADGDKKVDKIELMKVLRGLGSDPTKKEVDKYFAQLDVDSK